MRIRVCAFLSMTKARRQPTGNPGFLAPIKRKFSLRKDNFKVERICTIEKFENIILELFESSVLNKDLHEEESFATDNFKLEDSSCKA